MTVNRQNHGAMSGAGSRNLSHDCTGTGGGVRSAVKLRAEAEPGAKAET